MRKLALVSLILATACASGGKEEDKDILSNSAGDWSASLAQVNNSGVRGNAGVQSVVVGSGATISIEGATPGGQHPWHVHMGRCGSGGSIVGNPNSYGTLIVASDGRASGNASLGTALRESENYHVNVHRSLTDMGTIVACGNLSND